MRAVLVVTGFAAGLGTVQTSDAQLSRPGVAHLDAQNVVISVFQDSLDGVHVDARVLHKRDWVGYSARFDPEAAGKWVAAMKSFTSSNALDTSAQSPVLGGLGGTRGIGLARPAKKGTREIYWLLHRLEAQEPLLIRADPRFTDTLLTSLGEAARLSAIDSSAFVSGMVAPLNERPDSLGPWPISVPEPRFPYRLGLEGIDGLVQIRYVIGADGRAVMGTFEVLWASASEFIPPVVEALSRGIFRPSRLTGKPAPCRVYQDVRFRVGDRRGHWN